MTEYAVKGGIGDFLQCLPFMLEHPEHKYLVASHYDRAPEFFAAVGLTIEERPFSRTIGVPLCPRNWFFEQNPFKKQEPIFNKDRPVLGIHLGGSSYSVNMEGRFGFPSKALPLDVLTSLLVATVKQYNFLVFGTAEEFDDLMPDWRKFENRHLKFLANEDVTVSLAHVAECAALIGSDSAFKTMSVMLKIPTLLWVGNYKDDFRDRTFIDPYVLRGVMDVFLYSDFSRKTIQDGIVWCVQRLKEIQ